MTQGPYLESRVREKKENWGTRSLTRRAAPPEVRNKKKKTANRGGPKARVVAYSARGGVGSQAPTLKPGRDDSSFTAAVVLREMSTFFLKRLIALVSVVGFLRKLLAAESSVNMFRRRVGSITLSSPLMSTLPVCARRRGTGRASEKGKGKGGGVSQPGASCRPGSAHCKRGRVLPAVNNTARAQPFLSKGP